MHRHFNQHLNTKALIEQYQPQLIVEAGCGDSTVQLLTLREQLGFRLVCMDVAYSNSGEAALAELVPGKLIRLDVSRWNEPVELIYGVAHLGLELFADHEIDMAIVDTDHNGWTLERELAVLERKMKLGGLVLLHDTETFADTNGYMNRYESGEVLYPLEEIMAGPTMRQVVDRYKKQWPVIAETTEENGAIAFQVLTEENESNGLNL